VVHCPTGQNNPDGSGGKIVSTSHRLPKAVAVKLVKYERYVVQIGRGKGRYNVRYTFDNERTAILCFNGINIGNGYKKRLVDTETGTVLAKVLS
jgi:hypothetical protein